MCLAVPVQIVSLVADHAVIEIHGVRRQVNVSLVDDPQPGDWILVHAGFAIQKWSVEDVAEYRALMAQMQAMAGKRES